jgi:hypothetical protein
MLSVTYLLIVMLSVAMLSVVMLSVVMLSVVAPIKICQDCPRTFSRIEGVKH